MVQSDGVKPIAALKSKRGFDQSSPAGKNRLRSATQTGRPGPTQAAQPAPDPKDIIYEYVIRDPEVLKKILYCVVEIR